MIENLPSEFTPLVHALPHRGEVAASLEAILCATNTLRVAYLSVPVTTGPIFVDWFRREGRSMSSPEQYLAALKANVIDANVVNSQVIANKARGHWSGLVFNPALLYVRDWSQADYLALFLGFMRATVERVILSDGWALSNGCSIEAASAFGWGIPITDPLGEPMDRPSMLAALDDATRTLSAASLPSNIQIAAMKVISSSSHASEANG